jgi:hypothetical protein
MVPDENTIDITWLPMSQPSTNLSNDGEEMVSNNTGISDEVIH